MFAATALANDVTPQLSSRPFSNLDKNQNAPPQLQTFEFLIGEHICDDVLTAQDGTTTQLTGLWSGRYILNGNAIQDHYWNEQFAATNIRVFDPAQDKWLVTYFRFPDYRSGTWEGSESADKIYLNRSFDYQGQVVVSELLFENISPTGFYWQSSYLSGATKFVDWTSTCSRTH